MSLDVFKSKPALLRHGLSFLVSLTIHAALIYFLVVHFVSVKIIDFGVQVTPILLVSPEDGPISRAGLQKSAASRKSDRNRSRRKSPRTVFRSACRLKIDLAIQADPDSAAKRRVFT
jgi:hypothetical protein